MRSEREAAPPPPPSAVIRLQRTSATSDDTPAYVDLLHEPSEMTSQTADGNYLTLCELKSMLEKADAMSACAYSLASQTVQKEAVALLVEAYNKLEILKSWNGSRNAWIKLPLTKDQTHPLFAKGVTTSNVTSLRLLLKVDLLLNMLHHGELQDGKGVVFDISLAEEIYHKEVYFIQGGTYKPIRFADITEGPNGFFKALELSAKFETEIERYSFRNIPKASDDEKNVFLLQFADVVVDEKRRQLLHNLTGPTNLPWQATTTFNMPVVIWFRKGK